MNEMGIGWISRSQPAELVTTTAAGRRGDPRTATATYQPMEISGTAVGRLGEQALAHHEHAIAIRITITYYLNANVNASPGRLRKSQLRYGWHSFRHPQGCLVTWSRVG